MDPQWRTTTGSATPDGWIQVDSPTTAPSLTSPGAWPLVITYKDQHFHDRKLRELGDKMADLLLAHCTCGHDIRICQWCTLAELWWAARRDKTLDDLVRLRTELD